MFSAAHQRMALGWVCAWYGTCRKPPAARRQARVKLSTVNRAKSPSSSLLRSMHIGHHDTDVCHNPQSPTCTPRWIQGLRGVKPVPGIRTVYFNLLVKLANCCELSKQRYKPSIVIAILQLAHNQPSANILLFRSKRVKPSRSVW